MTRQEMFDAAYRGLASQNWQQSRDEGEFTMCLYRGPEGRKCAAGWLIPDNLYDPKMEGHRADSERIREAIGTTSPEDTTSPEYTEFLLCLQDIHDLNNGIPDMKVRLDQFAERAGFTIPQIEEITA
jgi:hypothetical protein